MTERIAMNCEHGPQHCNLYGVPHTHRDSEHEDATDVLAARLHDVQSRLLKMVMPSETEGSARGGYLIPNVAVREDYSLRQHERPHAFIQTDRDEGCAMCPFVDTAYLHSPEAWERYQNPRSFFEDVMEVVGALPTSMCP